MSKLKNLLFIILIVLFAAFCFSMIIIAKENVSALGNDGVVSDYYNDYPGKNLLNYPEGYIVNCKGTASFQWAFRDYLNINSGIYTISCNINNKSIEPRIMSISIRAYNNFTPTYSSVTLQADVTYASLTFTVPQGQQGIRIYLGSNVSGVSADTDVDFYQIQIETGSTATPYEPYIPRFKSLQESNIELNEQHYSISPNSIFDISDLTVRHVFDFEDSSESKEVFIDYPFYGGPENLNHSTYNYEPNFYQLFNWSIFNPISVYQERNPDLLFLFETKNISIQYSVKYGNLPTHHFYENIPVTISSVKLNHIHQFGWPNYQDVFVPVVKFNFEDIVFEKKLSQLYSWDEISSVNTFDLRINVSTLNSDINLPVMTSVYSVGYRNLINSDKVVFYGLYTNLNSFYQHVDGSYPYPENQISKGFGHYDYFLLSKSDNISFYQEYDNECYSVYNGKLTINCLNTYTNTKAKNNTDFNDIYIGEKREISGGIWGTDAFIDGLYNLMIDFINLPVIKQIAVFSIGAYNWFAGFLESLSIFESIGIASAFIIAPFGLFLVFKGDKND